MAGLAIDDAAWSSRWRDRSLLDKSVVSLGLVLAALLLPPWPGSVLVAATAIGLALWGSRTPPRLLLRALSVPLVFIVVGAASVAITIAVEPNWSIGVTDESLSRAAGVAGHALAGTLAVLLLALTTPMVDILAGLGRLRVPGPCIEVVAVMYRMLFILLDTTRAIHASQNARLGYSTASRSLRSAGALCSAVLLHAWGRARRLEQGLAGRGYVDSLPTAYAPAKSSPMFLCSTVLGLAALVAVSLLVTGPQS